MDLKGWKMFAEIKKYKELGLNKSQVERKLDINYKTVDKYWDMSHEDYSSLSQSSRSRRKKLEKYEAIILDWLKEFNDISASQVNDWIKERYNDFNIKDRTLRDFVHKLRARHNIPKQATSRQYEAVSELPMGYQAQVDMGQIWMKRHDGTSIKVYCFAMVLSHSRQKFVHWSDKPLTTLTFIDMHHKAFEFFGGMTKEIVYDQDRVLTVSENYGDIIFTEGFEVFRKAMKFKVRLCRGFDPESKGKIEAVVKYVKINFARYRIFKGLATLNDEAIKWLERTGNAKIHDITKKIPAEVFALEKQHLLPAPEMFSSKHSDDILTYPVRKDNTIMYKQNRYQLPKGTYSPGKKVELIPKNTSIILKDIETNQIYVTHSLNTDKGNLVKIIHPERDINTPLDKIIEKTIEALGNSDNARILLENIRREKSRYIKDQLGVILKSVEGYSSDILEKALNYCVERSLWSATTFKDVLQYLTEEKKVAVRDTKASIEIPSKYKGLKPEIRHISEYIYALKEDKKRWKN
jgi:transposase